MAGYPHHTSRTAPANGELERRLTTIEMTLSNSVEDIDHLTETVDRMRTTAFYIILSIAGSAIMLLVNILLTGKNLPTAG